VRDVAEGHWLAAQKGRVGQRYILAGTDMTLKNILDALSELSGLPAPRFKTPYAVAYAVGVVDELRLRLVGGEPVAPLDAVRMARHKMYFTAAKAVRELGLPQTPARTALKDAVDWFQANGYVR
jgi:dihydroflavonol-4-reductase